MKYAISFDDDVAIPNNSTSLFYIVEVYAKRALQPIKTHESSIRISVQSSLFSNLGFFLFEDDVAVTAKKSTFLTCTLVSTKLCMYNFYTKLRIFMKICYQLYMNFMKTLCVIL